MKSINKNAKVDMIEADVQKGSKFEKFKMKCEHIWKEAKTTVKKGVAVAGIGVMLTFASCGDTATGNEQDTGSQIVDVGNTQEDTGIGKDGGVDTGPKVDKSWESPKGYVDFCNTLNTEAHGDEKLENMYKFAEYVCTKLSVDNISLHSNDGTCGYTDGLPNKYSCHTTYWSDSGSGAFERTYFSINNDRTLCQYDPTPMGGHGFGIFVPTIHVYSGANDYIVKVGCNMGCVGKYTEVSGEVTCETKILVRVIALNGGYVYNICKEFFKGDCKPCKNYYRNNDCEEE